MFKSLNVPTYGTVGNVWEKYLNIFNESHAKREEFFKSLS